MVQCCRRLRSLSNKADKIQEYKDSREHIYYSCAIPALFVLRNRSKIWDCLHCIQIGKFAHLQEFLSNCMLATLLLFGF